MRKDFRVPSRGVVGALSKHSGMFRNIVVKGIACKRRKDLESEVREKNSKKLRRIERVCQLFILWELSRLRLDKIRVRREDGSETETYCKVEICSCN